MFTNSAITVPKESMVSKKTPRDPKVTNLLKDFVASLFGAPSFRRLLSWGCTYNWH
jgi:hypothetical protein